MDRNELIRGIRDGIPIALGYMAVAFSLGIAMRNAGMKWFEGFMYSALNLASAGEYAGLQAIAADAAYMEMAVVTLVANARYLLMSTALSQRFSEKTSIIHRFLVGYAVTDELFGLAIGEKGNLKPAYSYGAMSVAVPGWAAGTALGIIAGNILPDLLVRALSVTLFGMFLAIIIPPAKKDKAVMLVVITGFVSSFLVDWSGFFHITSGTKTIILTVVIAVIASILFPHEEEQA